MGQALSHSAVANVVGLDSVSDTLTLLDTAEVQHFIKTTSNTLSFQHAVDRNNIFSLSASNVLALGQNCNESGTKSANSNSTLSLLQFVQVQLTVLDCVTTLELTHSVTNANPKFASASSNLSVVIDNLQPTGFDLDDNLDPEPSDFDPQSLINVDLNDPDTVDDIIEDTGLRHSVVVRISIADRSLISYLNLSQDAGQGPHLEASNHIGLSQIAESILHRDVISLLRFSHSAVGHNVHWAEQTIDFTHVAVGSGVVNRSLTSVLALNSSVSFLIVDICNYTPGIGAGSFTYPAPSTTPPTLTPRSTTVLTWPYAAPTLTLSLRNPNFDNV